MTIRRRRGLFALGLVVSAAAAWLATRGMDLRAVAGLAAAAGPLPILGAIAVLAIQVSVRALRWRLLLPVDGRERVRFPSVLAVTLVGYLGNAVLPARSGEAVRAIVLARREQLPVPETIGSVVLERVLDTASLAALGLVAALVVGVPGWVLQAAALGASLALAALLVAALMPRLLHRVPRTPLAPIVDGIARVVRGAAVGPRPGAALRAVACCAVAWLLDAAMYWLVARSLALEVTLAGALVVSTVVALSTAVPSAPGYVGTFELAAVAAIGVLGVSGDRALAFALVAHAVAVLPIAAAGAIALAAMGRGPAVRGVEAGAPAEPA